MKKKLESWQPFPRFVHLKAVLCRVTTKQSLAQLFMLSRWLLSMECFPLKVSLWNSESWVLHFASFHTYAKFQDWLWCLSKVAGTPLSSSLDLSHPVKPWYDHHCPTWGHQLHMINDDVLLQLQGARGLCWWPPEGTLLGSDMYIFWNHRKHHAANVSQSCRPWTFWNFVLALVYDCRQT